MGNTAEPPQGQQPPNSLGWSPIEPGVEAVYAPPPSVDIPRPAPQSKDDDRIGWAMVVMPMVGGIAHLLIPIQIYAIVAGAITVVVSIVLMARDAQRHEQSPFGWVIAAIPFFYIVLPWYMHARRRWGGPLRLPYAIVSVVAFLAGAVLHGKLWGPAARVTVSCAARGERPQDGYACTPKHVSGYQSARACWDLALTCHNRTPLVEHVCAQVTLGEIRESVVPFEYSPGVDECDTIAEAKVDNLRVEVDPQWLERDVYPRFKKLIP